MDYLPYLAFPLALGCLGWIIYKLPDFLAIFENQEPQNFNDYRKVATNTTTKPRQRFAGDPSRHRLVRKVEWKPFDDAA